MKKIIFLGIFILGLHPVINKKRLTLQSAMLHAQIYGYEFEDEEDCIAESQFYYSDAIDSFRGDLTACLAAVESAVADAWIDFISDPLDPQNLSNATDLILEDLPEAYECIDTAEDDYYQELDIASDIYELCLEL